MIEITIMAMMMAGLFLYMTFQDEIDEFFTNMKKQH